MPRRGPASQLRSSALATPVWQPSPLHSDCPALPPAVAGPTSTPRLAALPQDRAEWPAPGPSDPPHCSSGLRLHPLLPCALLGKTSLDEREKAFREEGRRETVYHHFCTGLVSQMGIHISRSQSPRFTREKPSGVSTPCRHPPGRGLRLVLPRSTQGMSAQYGLQYT